MNLKALATILNDISEKGESRYDQVDNIEGALSVVFGGKKFEELDPEFKESEEGKRLKLLLILESTKIDGYKVSHHKYPAGMGPRTKRVGKKSGKLSKSRETSRKSVDK